MSGRAAVRSAISPQGMPKGETIPLLPAAEKILKARQSKDDPEANCLPTGVPRIAPYPWRIVQTPTHVFILFEGNIHSYRQIFMDGRKHPDDPDPTWYGHSIGHWEGDTLVVDTRRIQRQVLVRLPRPSAHREAAHDRALHAHGPRARWSYEITIDDPGAYTKPFTMTFTRDASARRRADGVHLPGEQPGREAHRGPDRGTGRSGAGARNIGPTLDFSPALEPVRRRCYVVARLAEAALRAQFFSTFTTK